MAIHRAMKKHKIKRKNAQINVIGWRMAAIENANENAFETFTFKTRNQNIEQLERK